MRVTTLPETEAQFQARVIDFARALGWLVAHFHDSRRQIGGRLVGDSDAAGFPDLVLVKRRVIYAELKGEKTRLRAAQVVWHEALRAAGEEVYLWRPADWPEIMEVLKR